MGAGEIDEELSKELDATKKRLKDTSARLAQVEEENLTLKSQVARLEHPTQRW